MAGIATAPTLVILIGLPGAGKSTLAQALARERGWSVVDRDRIRAAMFDRCTFSEEEKSAAGEAAWLAAETLLTQRRSCIVDGLTFAAARQRERGRELADLAAARFAGVFLDCPLALAAARVRAQPHAAADRSPGLVHAVAARFEPPEADCWRFDAAQPAAAIAAAVHERLG